MSYLAAVIDLVFNPVVQPVHPVIDREEHP